MGNQTPSCSTIAKLCIEAKRHQVALGSDGRRCKDYVRHIDWGEFMVHGIEVVHGYGPVWQDDSGD